jgi:hypothetical protein
MMKKPFAKIRQALVKVGLPAIGTALGGPAGGVVAGALAGLLGVDPKSERALDAALANASPEILAKLREIDASVALSQEETVRAELDAVTSRWVSDASSPHWLPNNIRPLTLAAAVSFWIVWNLLSACVVSAFLWRNASLDEALTGFFVSVGMQISGILGTVVVAYFGARSLDKRIHH